MFGFEIVVNFRDVEENFDYKMGFPLETHTGFIWSRLVSSDPPGVRRTVHFW